jgi:hypothetical protein
MQRKASIVAIDYFEQVLTCARLRDQARLNELLQKNYFSLDVLKGTSFGLISPAGFLEYKGEHNAADFLRQNGADVNYMGYGAALVGNHMRCEILRKEYGADPSFIAKGAAVAGNMDYAEGLYLRSGASWYDIVLGCVLGSSSLNALHFLDRHLTSITFKPDLANRFRLMNLSQLSEGAIDAFWNYINYAQLFYGNDEHPKLREFWRAVGVANVQLDDNLLLLWKFLNPSAKPEPWHHDMYYGMGLAGRQLAEETDQATTFLLQICYISGGQLNGALVTN